MASLTGPGIESSLLPQAFFSALVQRASPKVVKHLVAPGKSILGNLALKAAAAFETPAATADLHIARAFPPKALQARPLAAPATFPAADLAALTTEPRENSLLIPINFKKPWTLVGSMLVTLALAAAAKHLPIAAASGLTSFHIFIMASLTGPGIESNLLPQAFFSALVQRASPKVVKHFWAPGKSILGNLALKAAAAFETPAATADLHIARAFP